MKNVLMGLLLILATVSPLFADDEASNRVYVQSSEYGLFYAKSIPSESYGLSGKTQVFQVMPEQDQLLYTYDWYSPEIFISGYLAGPIVYVVQFGSWNRGHLASEKDLAVAFYKNNKLLKEYSTLDIVKDENNISTSRSHYTIFRKKLGFRRPWGNQIIFDVELHSGEILLFDVETGEIISKEEEKLGEQIYQTKNKVEQLKWQWYELNKEKIKDFNQYNITEEELKNLDPAAYPTPPEGYQIIPNKMWTQTQVIKK